MTKTKWPADDAARADAARALAAEWGATVVVKGHRDIISDGARVVVDEEDSIFATKGGYGDLLAGAAGALLARKRSPLEAAVGAAWLVGRAARLAGETFGEATLASDALARFGDALRS
jgi:ADP-dependent NAD(P)H-hydrate dehydratase / NAD(P)H-hydrate epimerase